MLGERTAQSDELSKAPLAGFLASEIGGRGIECLCRLKMPLCELFACTPRGRNEGACARPII
eukprot:scaffold209352_cov28-Tisochrysis_lutea.AAC.2